MALEGSNLPNWLIPVLLMLLVQTISVGINIFYKLAISHAMPTSILIAHRFCFGTISLAPLTIYKSWNNKPKLTWKMAYITFVCGLLGGSLYHNLHLESLTLTSAMFVSAIVNLNPVVTSILSTFLGLESLAYRTSTGRFKIIGIILSTAGVVLFTFYKRMEINICPFKFNQLSNVKNQIKEPNNQIFGLGLAVITTFCNAGWLIIQAKIKDDSDNIFLIPFLTNLMAAIQSVLYAICVEKDWAQWKLGWNIRLWAVSFSGILGSGMNTSIITWCVSIMGPLFVATFNPVGMVLMVAIGPVLLNEKLYLTSLIAIVLIIAAIVMLLWGKLREMNSNIAEQLNEYEMNSNIAEQSDEYKGV